MKQHYAVNRATALDVWDVGSLQGRFGASHFTTCLIQKRVIERLTGVNHRPDLDQTFTALQAGANARSIAISGDC